MLPQRAGAQRLHRRDGRRHPPHHRQDTGRIVLHPDGRDGRRPPGRLQAAVPQGGRRAHDAQHPPLPRDARRAPRPERTRGTGGHHLHQIPLPHPRHHGPASARRLSGHRGGRRGRVPCQTRPRRIAPCHHDVGRGEEGCALHRRQHRGCRDRPGRRRGLRWRDSRCHHCRRTGPLPPPPHHGLADGTAGRRQSARQTPVPQMDYSLANHPVAPAVVAQLGGEHSAGRRAHLHLLHPLPTLLVEGGTSAAHPAHSGRSVAEGTVSPRHSPLPRLPHPANTRQGACPAQHRGLHVPH